MFAIAGLTMFVIVTVVLFVFQVSILKALPRGLLNLIAYWPLLGMFVNLLCSGVILFFSGIGNTIAVCNVGSSILVLIWLVLYRRCHQLSGVKIKMFYIIPYPAIEVGNPEESSIF